MDRRTLLSFFRWCTLLNFALLMFYALCCAMAGDLLAGLHGTLFQIPAAALPLVLYGFMGLYKVLWLVFNVTPWLALEIMSRRRPRAMSA